MLNKITSLLKNDLAAINHLLHDVLKNQNNDFAQELMDYLLQSKGKMLRPILTLLTYYSLSIESSDKQIKDLHKLCAAIEIIHMASLVHDDIIDNGDVRRMKKTIHKKWGNEVAVILGVYLYSVSLKLIAEIGSIEVLSLLSDAVFSMCNGELIQLNNQKSKAFDVETYNTIISAKTGDLFVAACLCAVHLAGGSNTQLNAFKMFATEFGKLFQFTDDYLDLKDIDGQLKKEYLQDISKGLLTLPYKFLLEDCNESEQRLLLSLNLENKKECLLLINKKTKSDAFVKKSIEEANHYFKNALLVLNDVPNNKYSDVFKKILEAVINRIK